MEAIVFLFFWRNLFLNIIQFYYTIAQGKQRAMLYISKAFKIEQQQQQQNKININ